MSGVDALVAEVAVDLEDLLDTADDATLEEQFRRDTQVQVDVEGVGVRDERASCRAAVQRLQHRRLDLEEAAALECVTQRTDDSDALAGVVPSLGANDQIRVALTHPGLFAHFLVSDRQGAQRLGRDLPRVGHHAELAATGADDLTVNEDEVAEVDVGLPGGQCLFADAGEADHGLQLGTVAFLQSREAQLAGVAHEDDAADDTDQHTSRRVRLEFRVLRADLRERVGAIDRNRVRLLPLREDPFTLLAPDTELLGGVVDWLGFYITHGVQDYWAVSTAFVAGSTAATASTIPDRRYSATLT